MLQHAMLIPVLVSHLRFHRSLDVLEEKINYTFTNRYLLQLALTHPSYRSVSELPYQYKTYIQKVSIFNEHLPYRPPTLKLAHPLTRILSVIDPPTPRINKQWSWPTHSLIFFSIIDPLINVQWSRFNKIIFNLILIKVNG